MSDGEPVDPGVCEVATETGVSVNGLTLVEFFTRAGANQERHVIRFSCFSNSVIENEKRKDSN